MSYSDLERNPDDYADRFAEDEPVYAREHCRECGEQLQGWEAEDFAGPMGARCCARRTGCCAHAEAGMHGA